MIFIKENQFRNDLVDFYCRKLTLSTKICGRRLSVVSRKGMLMTQMRYFQLQTRGSALKRA